MPDEVRILQALAAAAIAAAVVFLFVALLRRKRPAWASAGMVLGVGFGFLAGCVWLGVHPHWPPREDQDRLLFLLFPSVFVVELLATALGRWTWLLRIALAASAAWILLYGSVYLEELAGPGSREWTPRQTGLILTLLAAALLAVWLALHTLTQRSGGRTVPLALAIVCAGAALTVMLSGYATGGQLGLPLAAAIGGVLLGSPFLRRTVDSTGATGVALVGLFALLIIGRFFGELKTGHALALLLAPLLCWLPELPFLRRLNPRLRGWCRVVLTAVPVIVVLSLAQQKFEVESAQTTTSGEEGSIDDYRSYGK